jgi:nitrite reductase/ring-hydroxylating ferredoxin subunit
MRPTTPALMRRRRSRRVTSTSNKCTVECPYHGSFFNVKTGHVLSFPASKPLKTYPVKVVNDEVFVEVG